MAFLEMRKHLELGTVPVVLSKLVSHKLARRQEQINTFSIGTQKTVYVRFGHQCRARPETRIARRAQRMPERAAFACLAGLSPGHEVVARAE